MNKALLIANNSDSLTSVKCMIQKYASCILTLSSDGNYRPTKANIEKALLWLRCSKCDSSGLLRCCHGFTQSRDIILYLVINLPNLDGKIISSDNKYINHDYLFSNLFYALPEGVKLSAILNIPINSLEFKLQKTVNGTYKICKQGNIPLKGDIKILSTDKIENIDLNVDMLSVLESADCLSFSGSFCINNAFLEP